MMTFKVRIPLGKGKTVETPKFYVQPDAYDLTDLINKKILPFFCEKMKQHEETIDPDSPRDYLDQGSTDRSV